MIALCALKDQRLGTSRWEGILAPTLTSLGNLARIMEIPKYIEHIKNYQVHFQSGRLKRYLLFEKEEKAGI
jgi:hypothetical protein